MSDSISRSDDDDDRDDIFDDDAHDRGGATAPTPAPAAPAPANPATPAADVQVARLYDAAFNRLPDSDGLAFWTNALGAGTGLDVIADAFVASPEFQDRYRGTDNDDYVERLYRNVLGREGDDDGEDYWEDLLDSGRLDRSDVLLAFSQSPEFAARSGSDDDPFG